MIKGRKGQMQVEVHGLERVNDALKKLARKSEEGARRAVVATATGVQSRARKAAPVDRGELRRGIKVYYGKGSLTAAIGAEALHSEVVEKGRGAGKRMPPHDAIAGWAHRKGIDPKLVYVIRRRIAEVGIEPRPYLIPAWDVERMLFIRRMADETRRAAREAEGGV